MENTRESGGFGGLVEEDLVCIVCGKSFVGEVPMYCCSGRDCGCMGMPLDPVVCSDECYLGVRNGEHFKNMSVGFVKIKKK